MNIIISNTGDVPIYRQIASQIKEAIVKEQLESGEMLPSIRTLAKELQISVITTKRAYDELEVEGFINSVPGKGSYVAGQNIELLKEARIKELEEKLSEAVLMARSIGLSIEEIKEMLILLYEEE